MQEDPAHGEFVAERTSTNPAQRANPDSRGTEKNWLSASQVFIDLEMPHLVLSRALDCGDDEAIWRCYQEASDQDACADWLASLAGSATRMRPHFKDAQRVTRWHSSLVAAPFVLPPGTAESFAEEAGADRSLAAAVCSEWEEWFPAPQELTVLAKPVDYTDLSCWSPVTQREYLAAMARQPAAKAAPRLQADAKIPTGYPQLRFLVGSLSRWLAFPEVPDPHAASARLWKQRTRLAGFLGCRYGCEVQPTAVHAPCLFAEAVLAGVRMWLQDLARRELVRDWTMRPAGRDLFVAELSSSTGDLEPVVLPLRAHQLGRGGVELITLELQQLFGALRLEARPFV